MTVPPSDRPATYEAFAASRDRRAGLGFALPATLWIVAFFGAPFLLMVLYSLRPLDANEQLGAFSLANYAAVLTQSAMTKALWNSVVTTAITVVISIALAYPFALAIVRMVPKQYHRLALSMAILPFWTSYVVRSYAWLLALSPDGIVNQALLSLGLISQPLTLAFNPSATILGFVHFFIMLNTLTIYASLMQINPRYELAARDLGASSWTAFRRVTLPLSIPGVAVGAFLTVVLAIGDYVTPQILGGNRELLLPQAIMLQVQKRLDLPMASAMSLVLTLVVAAVYLVLQRWLRMSRV